MEEQGIFPVLSRQIAMARSSDFERFDLQSVISMSDTVMNRALPSRRGDAYDPVAQLFHWLTAGLVVVQYGTKLIPTGTLGVFTEQRLNTWHVSIGPTILLLVLVRLAWRLTHPAPPPPDDLSAPLRLVSRLTHWLFYAILLLMPVLGWIAASAYGVRAFVLGLIPLPALAQPNDDFGAAVGSLHGLLAWVLLATIGLHVAGALYHAVIKRDGVMGRMLPVGANHG